MDALINIVIGSLILAVAALLAAFGLGMLHVPGPFGTRYGGSLFVLGALWIASCAEADQR